MKRSTLTILVLVAAGVGAGVWRSLRPEPPTMVVVAKAEKVPLLRSLVSATGEIRAKEFVDIQTEVAGVIVELLVEEGDEVQEGQTLLRLDALQLEAEVDSARAQLGAAEADARSWEVGVATAVAAVEQTRQPNSIRCLARPRQV